MNTSSPNGEDADVGPFVALLRDASGVDFSRYKRSSLLRRIGRRMRDTGASSYRDYLDYIASDSGEVERLLESVFVRVTGFFRDEAAWAALASHLAERIAGRSDVLRVWCAGCSSGEEAYSLAIAVADLVRPLPPAGRIAILATDIDEGALDRARLAIYPTTQLDGVSPMLRAKYIPPKVGQQYIPPTVGHQYIPPTVGHQYIPPTVGHQHRCAKGASCAVDGHLRACVTFERHDLLGRAPPSAFDLIACRNTLMYFEPETQSAVLRTFHGALSPNGTLFLGAAERIVDHARLFHPLDASPMLFSKVP